MKHQAGWRADSTGFRMTPEGEIVSEGPATIERDDIHGSADLLRYHRKNQVAHLEGSVHFTRGVQTFTCTRVITDFVAHDGQITGPVVISSDQGTVRAPSGVIYLSDQNQLTGLLLGTPCTGEGPKGHFSARTLMSDVGEGGIVKAYHLQKDAVVGVPGPPPMIMKTSLLDLTPGEKDVWGWTRPRRSRSSAAPGRRRPLRGRASSGEYLPRARISQDP